jgi:WD40 repeat protein
MQPKYKLCLFLIIIIFLPACASQKPLDFPTQQVEKSTPTTLPVTATSFPTPTIIVQNTSTYQPAKLPTPSPESTSTPPSNLTKIATFGKGNISPVFRSPDGKIVIVGRINGLTRWYDTETDQEEGSIDTDIREVFFSSDSSIAALRTFRGFTVLNLDTGKIIVDLPDGVIGYRMSPVFSPDMQFIALLNAVRTSQAFYEHIEIIRLTENSEPEILPILNEDEKHFMSAPAISPDGKLIAAGCSDKRVYIWDADSGKIQYTLEGHTDDIQGVAFSLDGSMLISSSDDGTLRIWDPQSGQEMRVFAGFTGGFPWVSITKDNKVRLGAANESSDLLVNPITGEKTKEARNLNKAPDPFEQNLHRLGYLTDEWSGNGPVSFSPDGRTLAMGGRNILLWDIKTQQLLISLDVIGNRSVESLVFSPNGNFLAASLLDNGLQVWDLRTDQTIFEHGVDPEMGLSSVYTPAFSSDSKLLAFGIGNSIEIWDLISHELRKSIEMPEKKQFTSQVAISKDGTKLYTIINWNMGGQVWDIATGKLITKIGFEDSSNGVFSASDLNPPFFARNNTDQKDAWIDIWNMDTGQVKKLPVMNSLNEPIIFSPDASMLLALDYSEQQLLIWDTETGALLHSQHFDNLGSMAINPELTLLATGHNGIIDLYDLYHVR